MKAIIYTTYRRAIHSVLTVRGEKKNGFQRTPIITNNLVGSVNTHQRLSKTFFQLFKMIFFTLWMFIIATLKLFCVAYLSPSERKINIGPCVKNYFVKLKCFSLENGC